MHNTNNTLRKPSVLIVDDDATIRLLMKDALTESTYDIHEFNNGEDAINYLQQHQTDLILLDVNMPGLSGFDVCTKIRQLPDGLDVSIVMVTALEDPESVAKSYDLGATDFISKPINWDTFPYRIQYLIKARSAIVEIKQHKSHLEYMEKISRVITQNKNIDTIMQDTMSVMLKIFSADRVILIKPDTDFKNRFIIDCEKTSTHINNKLTVPAAKILENNILNQANNSGFPIVSLYNVNNPAPLYNDTLQQQMLCALHLEHTHNWYLVLQQNTVQENWSSLNEETFYKISLRITNMLSRYLLTEKLGHSETLLKQAQKIGHLGNWDWNARTKQLTWSDEVYQIYECHQTNYSPSYAEYFKINFEEDNKRVKLLESIQNKTSPSYKIAHRIRTFNNGIKWVHEQCIGKYNDAGKLIEINGIVQDITDAYNKKEQEVHTNKMDAIGQLTSGVAHDFGNFMTVARGNLELLGEAMSKQVDINYDNMELLEDAYSAINDSIELTRQLLAFSRKKSIAPTYVNINRTIIAFKNLFKNTIGDAIKMSINVDKNLPDILVDPTQFESTLLNLIINARNAMPDGGTLEINAKLRNAEHSQEVTRNEDHDLGDKCICLYIRDSGEGMSADVLKHAIEPFYTTRTAQGTGLGLSTVYGFVKQSQGDLIIRSKPNQGATIYMLFPIYHGKAVEPPEKITAHSLHNIQATILIVEDRYAIRKFAIRCLNNPAINILEAPDATTAQKLLASNSIDLLFTDILMPGNWNGLELADWANKKYPDLKILLTTAIENENYKHSTIEHNFQLLQKPYSKNDLIKIISSFLTS